MYIFSIIIIIVRRGVLRAIIPLADGKYERARAPAEDWEKVISGVVGWCGGEGGEYTAKSAPVRRTPRSRERSARHGPDGRRSSGSSSRRRLCTGHRA